MAVHYLDSNLADVGEMDTFDESTLRQEDATLSYLKSRMEADPSQLNVKELVDEIKYRDEIERVFQSVFESSYDKELRGEELISQPRDFACMRAVQRYLDEECDDIMGNTYSLKYNRYVVDYCESTPSEE